MRVLLTLCLLTLLAGCDALKPAPPAASSGEPGPLDLPLRESLDSPSAQPRERSPERWLRVRWPSGLRLADSGVAGPGERPLLWYRFGLEDGDPAAAVSGALDAIENATEGEVLRSLHADPASGRVVGQLRNARLAASVIGEASSSTRSLEVTIEMLDARR